MCQHCIDRYLPYLKDEKFKSARFQGSIPLGKKKLGFCGRMPGDSEDQIDFTKEANTIGRNRIAKKNMYLYIFFLKTDISFRDSPYLHWFSGIPEDEYLEETEDVYDNTYADFIGDNTRIVGGSTVSKPFMLDEYIDCGNLQIPRYVFISNSK